MPVLLLIAVSLSGLPETEYARGSRTLFEELAELRVEDGRFAIRLKGVSDRSAVRTRALTLFPSVSRVSVRVGSGSTSTTRGSGSGEVRIQLRGSGGNTTFAFRVVAGDGREKIVVEQRGDGRLDLEIESRGSYVRLEQTKSKCSLRMKVDGVRVKGKGRSLIGIFQAHPLDARELLFAAIKRYLGEPPFVPLAAAPPGKTMIRLRDGGVIVGEVELEALVLLTDYGRLEIPRSELYHVFFPGSGAVDLGGRPAETAGNAPPDDKAMVVTRRFRPRGSIRADTFPVTTRYGDIEIARSDILHIAFGAVEEETTPAAADR